MPPIHKVLELLKTEAELAEFETFARQPGRSVDECHEWMLARGYVIGRGSVGRWMQEYAERRLRERFSRTGELAAAIQDAVTNKGGEFGDVAEAAVKQLTQVVLEQTLQLDADGEVDPLDVQRWTRSLANLVGSKDKLIKMLAAKFDQQMKTTAAQAAKKGSITADDIAAARKAIFGL